LPRQTSPVGVIFLLGASAPSLAPVVILLLDYEPRCCDKGAVGEELRPPVGGLLLRPYSNPRRFPPPWTIEELDAKSLALSSLFRHRVSLLLQRVCSSVERA
jgi:hypothetical protein